MKYLYIVIMAMLSVTLSTQSTYKQIPKFTFVQVNPSALDVMIHAFDQVLIYFHNYGTNEELWNILKVYEGKINITKQLYPNDHTLFAYINTTQDFKGLLTRFARQNGFKLINTAHTFHYDQSIDLVDFYIEKIHPKIPLIYKPNLIQINTQNQGYHLLFEYSTNEQLTFFNEIYEKIHNFLTDFNTSCYASPSSNKSISLYKDGKAFTSYNFYNRTLREAAEELIQFVNIDTLPTLIYLDQHNFHRVFGGSIQDQLLFIYNKKSLPSLQQVQQEFKKAAHLNRFQALSYQRILFNLVDTQFFDAHFNENIEQILQKENKQFIIYFTKTDYDRFQLKRYKFEPSKQVNNESILQFIEDVRSKKLDPLYKSEPTPSEQQQNKLILRKIVGNSFISQVYQKPQQSIIILFIDSKDEHSYKTIKHLLQQFTIKHKSQIQNKLITAIFDLDKNEHKLLYLKQAPQLIVFDKSNKKQTKYIKIEESSNLQALTKEIKKVVTNVDWNVSAQL